MRAIVFANSVAAKTGDETLNNWLGDYAQLESGGYVSIDASNDELDDTIEEDNELLGLDEDDTMSNEQAVATGRSGWLDALDMLQNKEERGRVLAVMSAAIEKRADWLESLKG